MAKRYLEAVRKWPVKRYLEAVIKWQNVIWRQWENGKMLFGDSESMSEDKIHEV